MEKEEVDQLIELYNNCESKKYIDKYGIFSFDLSNSQSLKTFVALIYNLEKDTSENLKINFSFYKNLCFGREYIRYEINAQGSVTHKHIFIQIPYSLYEYKRGLMFTIANVYIELYKNNHKFMTDEIRSIFKELTEQAYQDFVTNKPKN